MAALGTDIETKVYCCSNTTKSETKILATFDIVRISHFKSLLLLHEMRIFSALIFKLLLLIYF